jgi:acetolactate synthase-1/3 small subunit
VSERLTVLYATRPGATDRVMSLLRRRAFPIGGLTLERTRDRDISRMTVTVERPDAVEQVCRHLRKLPDVLDVSTGAAGICREYALMRVCCTGVQRQAVAVHLRTAGGRIVGETPGHLVVEAAGTPAELDALIVELDRFGIDEMARTASVALRAVPIDTSENGRRQHG